MVEGIGDGHAQTVFGLLQGQRLHRFQETRAYLALQGRVIGKVAFGDRGHTELGAQRGGDVALGNQAQFGDDGGEALVAAQAQAPDSLQIGLIDLPPSAPNSAATSTPSPPQRPNALNSR